MTQAHIPGAPSRQKIGRQIVLPFSKAFEIAWEGIRIRVWRSLITMSGIVLAIAFLTSVWAGGAFTNSLRRVPADNALYPYAQSVLEAEAIAGGGVQMSCMVVYPDEPPAGAQGIAAGPSIRDLLDDMAAFEAEGVPSDPRTVAQVLAPGEVAGPDVVVLVGLPDGLRNAEMQTALRDYVRGGGFVLIYGSAGADALSNAEALADLLPAHSTGGTFRVEPGRAVSKRLAAPWQAQPLMDVTATEPLDTAQALASAGEGTVVWARRVGRGQVAWYPVTPESAVDPDQLSWFLRGRPVAEAGTGDPRTSLLVRLIAFGRSDLVTGERRDTRGLWLVTLSLMVCVVGITNAMLMSVTERFREIGTMKCLGALDRFIVKLFLIESSLQGLAGSLAGAAIGFVLALLRALLTFHVKDPETGLTYWLALRLFPTVDLLRSLAVALAVGIALTIVAAIYPAIRAARMQPIQAMRSEA